MKKHVIINLTLISNMLDTAAEREVDHQQQEPACLYPTAAFFEVEPCQDEQLACVESETLIPLDRRDNQQIEARSL